MHECARAHACTGAHVLCESQRSTSSVLSGAIHFAAFVFSWLGVCQFGVCPFGVCQFGVCQFGSRLLGQGASYWGYERAPPHLAFYTWIWGIEFRFSC